MSRPFDLYSPIGEAVRAADALLSFIAIVDCMNDEAKALLRAYLKNEADNTRAPEDLRDRVLLTAALNFLGDPR
jgi:hypothetical protein